MNFLKVTQNIKFEDFEKNSLKKWGLNYEIYFGYNF